VFNPRKEDGLMPFGIGGGAFGLRGGISTRGIGVGAGPFSAGTSWRGRRSGGGGSGGGGLLAWLITAAILFFIAAWPFLLGTFIAVRLGAWNPSTECLVTGLCFEVVYVAALVGWFFHAREQRNARSAADRNGSSSTADWKTRDSVRWPATILVAGFAVALVVLLVDPIHSAAEDASSHACPSETLASSTSGTATVPDVVGANAAVAETRLKSTGFTNVNLESANPDYKSVWVASNWTVLSSDPARGCVVSLSRSITVYVTK
jgi:hypothetical protein